MARPVELRCGVFNKGFLVNHWRDFLSCRLVRGADQILCTSVLLQLTRYRDLRQDMNGVYKMHNSIKSWVT